MQDDTNKELNKAISLSTTIADWFKKQLDLWTSKGILNSDQRKNIENLYLWPQKETVKEKKEKPPISIVTILEFIGVSLIGIGVISIIAYNWPKMPNHIKLVIIITTFLSIQGLAFFLLNFKPALKKTGFNLLFLGNLLYGGGIWLVAQMYHLQYPFSTGFFIWALGVIPFAYIFRSKLNYFLALFLFIQWTFIESCGLQRPHLYFLFILLSLLIPLSYYLKTLPGLTICIVCGGIWLLLNNIFWFEENISVYLFLPILLYGVLLLSSSNFHLCNDKLKQYKPIYYNLGCMILGFSIFLLPFFGTVASKFHTYPFSRITVSFWICSGIMFLGVLVFRFLSNTQSFDKQGKAINTLLPSLLFIALFSLVMPYLKSILILNLIPVAIIIIALYYFTKSKIIYVWTIIYLLLWLPFCLIQWEQPLLLFLLYLIFSLMCYLSGWYYITQLNDSKSGIPLKTMGLILLYVTLYILTFSSTIEFFSNNYKFPSSFDFWFLFILFYICSLFLLKYFFTYRFPKYKLGVLPEEICIFLLLMSTPLVIFFIISNNLASISYVILSNFFYLGILIFYLVSGYRRREPYLKICSLLFLLLLVYSRYFEIEFSLLYKSILFIFSGVFILALGILFEKNKERVAIIEQH